MKRALYSLLLILGHSTVICLSIDAILEFGEPDDPKPVNLEDLNIDVLPVGPLSTTGQQVQKVRQVFKGLDVLGYGGTCEVKNGALKKVVIGTFVTGIENDVTSMLPLVTKEAAVKTAFESLTVAGVTTSFQPDDSQNPNFRLQIYVDTVKLRAVLVYQLNFLVSRLKFGELVDVFNAFVTVDAITGDILRSLEQVAGFKERNCNVIDVEEPTLKERRFQAKSFLMRGDGGNQKCGRYRYGEGKLISKALNVTKISRTRCELTNQYVTVSSAAGCQYQFGSVCFNERFIERCNLRTPSEDNSATNTSQAHDALFLATEYIKMMREVFKDKTLEEKCTKVKLCTSFGVTNSFHDLSNNRCEVYFGISSNITYDQVSESIVGHELAHILTNYILPFDHTGALVESFSDLSALVFKAYLNNTPVDAVWMFGNEIRIERDNQTAVRYIDDPPRDGFSVDCMENYLLKPPPGSPNAIHFNNGIYNKAIYFLVTDKGWTLNKVFRMFLLANKRYWYQTIGFTKGLCGLILAAENLKFNTEDVRDSFAKVGVFCGCPKHWIRVKQNTGNTRHRRIRCFKVITDEMTWSNARAHCNQIGGYLVSLDNESKAESLLSVIMGKARQYWIGGSELLADPKEKLVWPFGKKFNWPDSLTGQSNEAGTTHDCLTVLRSRQKLGLANDRCDKQKQFVCEKTCCGKNCANIS